MSISSTSSNYTGASPSDAYNAMARVHEQDVQAARTQEAKDRAEEVSSTTLNNNEQVTRELSLRFRGGSSVASSSTETTSPINATSESLDNDADKRMIQIALQNKIICLHRLTLASLTGLAVLPCLYLLSQAYANCYDEDLEVVADCKAAISKVAFSVIFAALTIQHIHHTHQPANQRQA